MKNIILNIICLLFFTLSFSQFTQQSVINMKQSDAQSFLRQKGFPNIERSTSQDNMTVYSGKSNDGMKIFQYIFWNGYPSINQIAFTKEFETIQTTTPLSNWVRLNKPYNLNIKSSNNNLIVLEDDSTMFEEIKNVWEVSRINTNFIVVVKYKYYYRPIINSDNSYALLNGPTLKFGDTILNLENEDTFDLVNMFQNFGVDFINFATPFLEKNGSKMDVNSLLIHTNQLSLTPKLRFQSIGENIIAIAIGKDENSKVEIIFDPDFWQTFNQAKRFYVLYHELGHDIFNLNHGNGGKMMFNYADRNITWDDFIRDRESMFERVLANFLL